MNLLIIGHARHGKDTVAQMIKDMFGFSFVSSSQAAADIFIYQRLKDKYGYSTPQECFEDRVNHRAEWHDLICEYNFEDKARLAKAILKRADIYVGMRSNEEIQECIRQGLFDYIIGVYDPRKPHEAKDSFNINLFEEADLIIPNGGSLGLLESKVYHVIGNLSVAPDRVTYKKS
jgi:dephospho-CoA kinase